MHTSGRASQQTTKKEPVGTMLICSVPIYITMLYFRDTSDYLLVLLIKNPSQKYLGPFRWITYPHPLPPPTLINVGKCCILFACLFFNKNGNNHQIINIVSRGRENLLCVPSFFCRIEAPTSFNINTDKMEIWSSQL